MLGLDATRENYGWIGAAAADLVDPDFDALHAALTCAGTATYGALTLEDGITPLMAEDGDPLTVEGVGTATFDPEKIADRTITVSGATLDTTVWFAYGGSMRCDGVQYTDLAIVAPGWEDFGIRARVRLDPAGTGLRNVVGLSNGAAIVQVNAAGNWQVMEFSAKASSVPAVLGVWHEVALEREGLTFVLKINERVAVTWDTSFNGAATAVRVGSGDGAAPAKANYNDVRYYQKGVTAVRKLNKRPMMSRFRRTLCGVGRL